MEGSMERRKLSKMLMMIITLQVEGEKGSVYLKFVCR